MYIYSPHKVMVKKGVSGSWISSFKTTSATAKIFACALDLMIDFNKYQYLIWVFADLFSKIEIISTQIFYATWKTKSPLTTKNWNTELEDGKQTGFFFIIRDGLVCMLNGHLFSSISWVIRVWENI